MRFQGPPSGDRGRPFVFEEPRASAMPSMVEEVQQAISAVESGAGRGFAARAQAIELLEVHVLDRLEYLGESTGELESLGARAAALRERLERTNERVVQRLRDRIRAGRYTREGLTAALSRKLGPRGRPGSYDLLDLFVSALLDTGAPAEERATREPEMVFYQPTPARAILDVIERAGIGPEDVFCDLGSGLGRVVLLVALLSGARVRGVEFEPAYHEHAERCASALNLRGVELVCADAREASLAEGTVYFLYTPFRGALLQQVLARLHAEARDRPIRVCTFGPCTAEVARASWLRSGQDGALSEDEIAVFFSRA